MHQSPFYFLFHDGRLLLTADGKLPEDELPPVRIAEGHTLRIFPELDEHPCYAAEIEDADKEGGFTLTDLRSTFDILPPDHYKQAGKIRELLHWDRHTRYCSTCGAPMQTHTEISKRCTRCGREVWPLLATAIIVAVTRRQNEEILLVQSNSFKRDYYGLVAGFVETGESLEECVRREVMEETCLHIKNIRYFGSQPWPYPCGLMVGFTAEYDGGELQLQRSELNKGGWFRYDRLPAIPGRVSLARRLIDHWLNTRQARQQEESPTPIPDEREQ